ncbi:ASKHA domain-containing protein [Thermosulfuriphilus sp.]
MPKITFLPAQIEIETRPEEPIIRAAMRAGVHINASCGGAGVCGKCRIFIESGQAEGEMLPEGGYKACVTVAKSDLVVRVPIESQMDRRALQRPLKKTAVSWIKEGRALKWQLDPVVTKVNLELPHPSLSDNASDLSRLLRELKATLGTENIFLDPRILKKLPYSLREQAFRCTVSLFQPAPEDSPLVFGVEAGDGPRALAVAIDIGTTTVCGELIDLISGKVLANLSDYNPQVSYGEDIISRIEFARKEGGLRTLHSRIIECISRLIREMCQEAGVGSEEVVLVSLAGNTTMSHFFLELEPRWLREAPYVPVATIIPPVEAEMVGLPVARGTRMILAPSVASYVGGDIVSGVVASGMYREEPLTLFIDIGTNGEIVVGNKDWLACAACSAGPAFEGGGIKHGMRATTGAIEAVHIDPLTFEPMILTIGGKKPKGICGSGIIALLANLFTEGIIDRQGKFLRNLDHPRVRQGRDGWEYVLVFSGDSATGEDIVFTEADIDNLIRAKGAMYAGYLTLLESVGLTIDMVERVLLAGNFGSYLDLEQAITIGLLPDLPRERFFFIGNSSLLGAKLAAVSKEIAADMRRVAQMMTNFELSENPRFMDHYVSSLFLPHTDLNLFPSIKERLNA